MKRKRGFRDEREGALVGQWKRERKRHFFERA
jgi:hypothetical protein